MKVIDLLNKIANGELAFEQEFKHNGFITDMEMFCEDYYFNEEILNSPIELIEQKEEDKEIEDTKYMRHHEGDGKCYIESKGHKYYVPYNLLLLIDDLVKAVNELKKGK